MQTTGTTGIQATNAKGEQLTCNLNWKNPSFLNLQKTREYSIFPSDWKHIVGTRYAKWDAITLLRANLRDKPLKLIKGIGTGYDAVWEYLNTIYGNPRYVLDSIMQDISKFEPLQDGEESRFCHLVRLVRHSYNTLKEVECQGTWTIAICWP